jgi:hypothetical protein
MMEEWREEAHAYYYGLETVQNLSMDKKCPE